MGLDNKLKTGLRDLEHIADEGRTAPSNLRLEELIDNLEVAEEILCKDENSSQETATIRPRRLVLRMAGLAASLALVASAAVAWDERPPKDTFDDPELAYAEVEEAFAKVCRSLAMGAEASREAEARFVDPVKAIGRIANGRQE